MKALASVEVVVEKAAHILRTPSGIPVTRQVSRIGSARDTFCFDGKGQPYEHMLLKRRTC